MPFPDRSAVRTFALRLGILTVFFGLAPGVLPAQSVRVTVPEENFRKEPRVESGNRLATVLEGAVLETERTQGRWHRATLSGWIWAPSVAADSREGHDLVVSKPGGENLRDRPDAGSRRVAILERGMLLDRVETSGNWVRVRRTAWIWSGSVAETGAVSAAAPAVPAEEPSAAGASGEDAPAAGSLPDRLVVSGAPVTMFVSPDGDSVATLRSGTDVAVVARQGEWARVRLEGWILEQATLPADSAAASDSLTALDLRNNPQQYIGRRVLWTVQFVSLETAEAVRTDFYEGEPFILARPVDDRSQGFVYLAVPEELLPQVREIRPLETIQILGRVRAGRSALMGVPILDLLALR